MFSDYFLKCGIEQLLCIYNFPALTKVKINFDPKFIFMYNFFRITNINRNTSWNIYKRRYLCISTVYMIPKHKFTYFPYHSGGTGTKKRNSCFSMPHVIEGCWKPFNIVPRCINNTSSFYWRRKVCTLTSRKRRMNLS